MLLSRGMRKHTLVLTLSLILAACSGSPGKAPPSDDFSGASGKDDQFGKKLLIVGSISGTSILDVLYANPPLYRGVSVWATEGATLRARVSAPTQSPEDADPVAWILDAQYRVVAKNDDADDSTVDSLVEARNLAAGTYFVVFREYANRSAWFHVAGQMAVGGGDDAGAPPPYTSWDMGGPSTDDGGTWPYTPPWQSWDLGGGD